MGQPYTGPGRPSQAEGDRAEDPVIPANQGAFPADPLDLIPILVPRDRAVDRQRRKTKKRQPIGQAGLGSDVERIQKRRKGAALEVQGQVAPAELDQFEVGPADNPVEARRALEGSDLFQAVWLDVYNDLSNLRDRNAVKPWLMAIVRNKCFHWKRKQIRIDEHETVPEEPEHLETQSVIEAEFVDELLRDQLVREAIGGLDERCRELIHLLFFAQPPLPYKEAAEAMGLATGSIGFMRGKCLRRLQKQLEELDAL